ncbi:MAG: UbiA family prenyltransferase [Betaproteobacteria bacterium]|nr:UbiA family prenyltransferase [Betaproteobacteria bacterium]
MNWQVALKLGRISNLPTVWTNVLAGLVLAGGAIGDSRVPWLLLALSLCYMAGMFLNDAFDREFDARHRPERPIPSRQVAAATVFGAGFAMLAGGVALLVWVGRGFAEGTGWRPAVAGITLGAAIVFYDWHHKQNSLSPVVMGLCRMLVYAIAGYAFVADPPLRVFFMGFLLLCFLIGLTYIAKQEHLEHVANLWPLAFMAVPLFWGLYASLKDAIVAGIGLLFLLWVLYSLSFLWRRRPGDVPRAVGGLLAGICLWDALVMAAAGQPSVAAVALVLFALTLLLQRYVSPT